MKVSILDYGAGNVRSVRNAIIASGYTDLEDIATPQQIADAECIVFPGVGSYQTAMNVLAEKQFIEPLQEYLKDRNRPFLGICLGMQTLFESSEEIGHSPKNNTATEKSGTATPPTTTTTTVVRGLGIIPGKVIKFDPRKCGSVPHIGWNGRIVHQRSPVLENVVVEAETYFVHSYYAEMASSNIDWVLTSTQYGSETFISSIQNKCIVATQFHPEKSGTTGLQIMTNFLNAASNGTLHQTRPIDAATLKPPTTTTQLTKRIVVALDVRTNDDGDLVVTKGDQYDVREKMDETTSSAENTSTSNGQQQQQRGNVRNLGKPVTLAQRYYNEGADEIAFLNITSFRQGVIEDMPMLHVLEEASKNIFVPLTVGGGIRSYTDPNTNQTWSAVEVASRYFRAGADKVSLGSDAVYAAEAYIDNGNIKTGTTAIEMISDVYGVQAVVISIDPKRVYISSPNDVDTTRHVVIALDGTGSSGPNNEQYCYYQCTVKGGRELRNICAVTVAKVCEQLGAGEIMLNCIDMDGQGKGYDHTLMNAVATVVTIPVIASSGAGTPQHFTNVFTATPVQAALAAGMFHRKEVEIEAVKDHMRHNGIPARRR